MQHNFRQYQKKVVAMLTPLKI